MIMLDTNHCLSLEPASPMGSPPMGDDLEKADLRTDLDMGDVYHSLKEALQLKLQQRRTREELVSQGIMPPLKSPAAFHEQRRSLERARTEDYLKRKIRSRPERSELVRMHILEETSAEPSLQAKQLQLKRARLADDLNDKISHRPGPIELVHKNILPVALDTLPDSPKGAGGESSLDEDSSDALSPDQLTNHDSPLGSIPQLSPSDMLTPNGDMSPSQSKSSSDRPPQRSKKAKDNKPKVKKLKYHQYIPPDQKADKEPPPQLDSSYAKILQQQQLFLQLQILNQQQQHYNYHTILPAPPKPPTEPTPSAKSGPSPSRSVPTTTTVTPSNQSGPNRQSQTPLGGAKPGTLPANLDEFKACSSKTTFPCFHHFKIAVAELKLELKLRGLTVSGTKNDLIDRLRNYQEQNGGGGGGGAGAATTTALKNGQSQPAQPLPNNATATPTNAHHQSTEGLTKVPPFSLAQGPVPGRVMRFGSTSSSPPVSPTPSERSLAGMSPDETSCNGDMFGEMVSSPLTQLTLQHSPQNPAASMSPLSQVKEENHLQHSSCSFSRPSPARGPAHTQKLESQAGHGADNSFSTSSSYRLDKDQMLQEKDKQIEELTRMLRQKQRLVESLRSQLEHGKTPGGTTTTITTTAAAESGGTTTAPTTATTITVTTATEAKPQTLFKASVLQPPMLPNGMLSPTKVQAPSQTQTQARVQQQQQAAQGGQQKNQVQLRQVQVQVQKPVGSHVQHKRAQRVQQQQQQQSTTVTPAQQVPPVFQMPTQTISLDLLKANGAPTLVTDGNGNHYLIALTSNATEAQSKVSPGKTNGRIMLQRLQSTPNKLSSQSINTPTVDTQPSEPPAQPEPVGQAIKKVQKAGLHLETSSVAEPPSHTVSAPPSLQPFFDDVADNECQSTLISSLKSEEACPPYDRHTLFTPPSPKPKPPLSTQRPKENGQNSQQMDDLFDILLKSGEISGFKANPDPSLAHLHSDSPSPASPAPLSPLHLSPPSPPPAEVVAGPTLASPCRVPAATIARLEDFLDGVSGAGASLLGAGPLTLMDELHSQMLGHSPMDTSDLGFSPHHHHHHHPPSPSLGFEDPTLDSMDWLDISMAGSLAVGGEDGGGGGGRGAGLAPLAPPTPPSVFSADFLDSSDLQLHWESCL
ncbi:hypothetical protein CRUP_004885 [Coryphaenoides rupestris]|nr:hypothetical protein CRUP_004885 [Coryphaenoides rupestris]